MDVTIENMPELRVRAVHHKGPYSQIPTAFAKLGEIAHAADISPRPDVEL